MRKKIKLASVLLAALLLCALLPTFASATMPGLPGHGVSDTADPGNNVIDNSGLIYDPTDHGGCIIDPSDHRPFIGRENEEDENGQPTYPIDKVDGAILDLADGDIVLYPDGYRQPGFDAPLTAYAGNYIIKGARRSDTPLRIINMSGESAVFDLYFDSAEIRAADWCAAASITCSADTTVNIVNVGTSIVQGYNHPAFVGSPDNGAKITVNILNTHYSSLTLNHLYLYNRTLAYAGNTNGEFLHNDAIEMFVNGAAPRNNSRMVLTDGCDVPEPESASEQPDADGGPDPCEWCGGAHSGPFGKLFDLFHSIVAFFTLLFGQI
ncbi:MAG: hypothetical protein IK118_03680 [Clostridia bacterium]|nr:hypothetical protein [Clostridia bacterium]